MLLPRMLAGEVGINPHDGRSHLCPLGARIKLLPERMDEHARRLQDDDLEEILAEEAA